MDDDERRLLSALARRYYLEDAAKTELATEFSISRFRVARLLQQARETGIVTIEINDLDERRSDLSQDLAAHLGLEECVVVKAGDTEQDNRRRLARVAATTIRDRVRDGDLLGLSWGRTLAAIGEELADLPPCTIIQLTGTVGSDLRQSPVEVIRRIAGRSSVDAVAIFAPLFAASEEAARTFRSDPAIGGALERLRRPRPGGAGRRLLGPAHHAGRHAGHGRGPCRADAEGHGRRGRGHLPGRGRLARRRRAASRRRISVSVDQLLATPSVLAVAGSVEKVAAIGATRPVRPDHRPW